MPREWGPDERGRWGNNMMALRDNTADQAIIVLRRARRLRQLLREGKATRAGSIRDLTDVIEAAMRIVMNMQAADAPVNLDALDEIAD